MASASLNTNELPPIGGSLPLDMSWKQLESPDRHSSWTRNPNEPTWLPTRTMSAFIPCFRCIIPCPVVERG